MIKILGGTWETKGQACLHIQKLMGLFWLATLSKHNLLTELVIWGKMAGTIAMNVPLNVLNERCDINLTNTCNLSEEFQALLL